MKKFLIIAVSMLLAGAAFAAHRPLYRIGLRDGGQVLAIDRPLLDGTVLVFHAYPGGALTGRPQEDVLAVARADRTIGKPSTVVVTAPVEPAAGRFPPPIQPGEIIDLGPTGGDHSTPATAPSTAAPSTLSLPGGVYDPRNPMYGGYSATGSNPVPGTAGDLARAISTAPPTADAPFGTNGFPITSSAPTPTIGADGQPIIAPTGAPGSTPLNMGPNGAPILAPPGTPGSGQPVIGPNGTPVLAPPGAPGSAPPTVGPNGYPAAPAPGSKG